MTIKHSHHLLSAALAALVLMSGRAMASREGAIFNSATELRDWCREESEAAFIAKGVTPYNWAASYRDEGNVFFVKGQWHINSSFVTVECSAQKGSGPRSASMSIQDAPADADDGS